MQTFNDIKTRLESRAADRFHRKADGLEPQQQAFINWVARELSNVYREMGQSRDYIEKNVLQKLQPELKKRPRPVHTLAQKHPKKHGTKLSHEEVAIVLQRMSAEPPHDIYFSPLRPTVLVNAQVKFRWMGQHLEELSDATRPQQILTTKNGKTTHESAIWWGIELGKDFEPSADLHFHVDWVNLEEKAKAKMIELLPIIRWQSEGENLRSAIGYGDYLSTENAGKNRFLDAEYMFLQAIEAEILQHYEAQFITIATPEETPKTADGQLIFPEEITNAFDIEELTALCPPRMMWVKMIAPSGCGLGELGRMRLRLNCFLVVNRKLIKSNHSPSNTEFIEVISLNKPDNNHGNLAQSGDYFLGMQKVFGENKMEYRSITFEDFQTAPTGFYTLQSGNVEARDLRDLQSRIAELTHYLQNETARLQRLPNLSFALQQIENGVQELTTALRLLTPQDLLPGQYLHVRLVDNQGSYYVRFWVTQGEVAREMVASGRPHPI